jgi:hypothetical protein
MESLAVGTFVGVAAVGSVVVAAEGEESAI